MMAPTDLTRWFEAHAPALVLYARQWLDRTRAEDAVQEAFVRLLGQRTPPRNVKAWLYRAVRNQALDQWRAVRRRTQRERATAADEAWFEPPEAENVEESDALARAIAALPPAQREVVVLRVWGELTLAEVAELVAAPVSTVFHHYQAALEQLRQRMDESCEKPKKRI